MLSLLTVDLLSFAGRTSSWRESIEDYTPQQILRVSNPALLLLVKPILKQELSDVKKLFGSFSCTNLFVRILKYESENKKSRRFSEKGQGMGMQK